MQGVESVGGVRAGRCENVEVGDGVEGVRVCG